MADFGLSESLRYFEYLFDSADADVSFEASQTSLDWPNFTIERPLRNIAGLKILECQIPFSFYIINEYNNKFKFTSTTGTFTVPIPVGNYDSGTLISATILAMTTADPAGNYVITFDSLTGKFTFYSVLQFSLDFGTERDDSLASIYGFNLGQTITSNTIISAKVAEISGPMYLYLCSETLGTLCQVYLPATSSLSQGGLGPEMAKIPVNVGPFGIINWQDPDPQKFFDVESLFQLQALDFYITLGTSFRKPLKLNGLSFSIKLGIVVNKEDLSAVSGGLKRVRAR